MAGHALATLIGSSTYPGASSPAVSGSMAANITGNWMYVANKKGATFEFVWDGGTGQFGFEISNEYHPQLNPSVTGTTLTLSAADAALIAPAGSASRGAVAINLLQVKCMYIRPIYTRSSGSGTGRCTACAE